MTRRPAAVVALVLLAVLQLTWTIPRAGAQDPAEEPPTEEPTTTTTTAPPPATPMVTAAPDPGATPATAPTARRLDLRAQTPFVAPNDTFSMKLAVKDAPEGATVAFELSPPITAPGEPVQSRRDRLDEWVTGRAPRKALFNRRVFPFSLFTVAADGTVSANLPVVPASQPDTATGFRIDDAGVYPLTVSLLPPDSDQPIDSFTTYLIRLPTDKAVAPPLQVASIVNLHAPLATRPDGTASMATADRALIQATVDTLDRHPDVPLTVDPTPETVDALVPADPRERNAASTTGSLIDTLARVISGREVLSSTFVDVDIDAWVEADLQTHLDRQLTLGHETLNQRLHPTPSADRHTWKTEGALTGESLSRLREFGVEQMIVPDTVVQPLDAKAFTPVQQQIVSAQPFDIENQAGGKLRAGASDQRLAGRLSASTNPVLAAEIALADLALVYYSAADNPNNVPATPRGIVLDVPADATSLRAFDAVLAALATVPVPTGGGRAAFAPVTLDGFFRIPPATAPKSTTPLVRPTDAPAAPSSMGDYASQLSDAEKALSAYTSMIGRTAPERVTAQQRLLDVSGAAGLDGAERRRYLDEVRGTVAGVATAISAPEQDQITLTDFEATVKVQLENTLAYPVDVLVVLTNEQLVFDDQPKAIEIHSTLQPGDNRLPVKVRTRTSCVCSIELEVFAADRSLPLDATRYRVRFTVISGLGLVLTISAGFFLMLWWGKNWRKTVRARKLIAVGDHPARGTDGSGDTPPTGSDADADTGPVPAGSA